MNYRKNQFNKIAIVLVIALLMQISLPSYIFAKDVQVVENQDLQPVEQNQTDNISPQTNDTSPQTDDTSPQTDDTSSQTDDTSPQTDNTSPQTDDTSPKTEDTSPKTDDTSSKTDDTSPKTDDTSLKTQIMQPRQILKNTSSTSAEITTALENAEKYYQSPNYKNSQLDNFNDIGAVLSGFGSLKNYLVMDYNTFTPSTYSPASAYAGKILELLATNQDPTNYSDAKITNKNLISDLQSEMANLVKAQNNDNEKNANTDIIGFCYGVIALNAAGVVYDDATADNYVEHYYNNVFDDGSSWSTPKPASDFGGADNEGIILLALSNNVYAASISTRSKIVASLQGSQLPDGGWAASYEPGITNSCTTATVISGIISAYGSLTDFASIKNNKNPADALLTLQNSDGGFRLNNNATASDNFSTFYCVTALGDFKNGDSIWHRLNTVKSTPTADTTVINDEVTKANNLSSNGYTASTYGAMKSALAKLENAITPNDIYTNFISLRISINNLVASSGGGNGGGGISFGASIEIDGHSGTILPEINYSISTNDSVFDLLKTATSDQKIELISTGSGTSAYVKGIGGLSQGDYGKNSGWQYSVNGKNVGLGAGSYILQNGDSVVWQYIDDYTKDTGSGGGGGSSPNNKIIVNSLSKYILAKPTPQLDKNIDAILAQALANDQTQDDLSLWQSIFVTLNTNIVNQNYIDKIAQELDNNKGIYSLPTDLSKAILSLQIFGQDPTNFYGYNLIDSLQNFNNIDKQGLNGYIYALLALSNQNLPADNLINSIKKYQNADGGFSLNIGDDSEIDISAMAMYALAKYKDSPEVETVLQNALSYLEIQVKTNIESSETIAQIMLALEHLEIDINDKNFVSNGKTLLDRLMEFYVKNGEFSHTKNGTADSIATEQCILALQGYQNLYSGANPVFVAIKADPVVKNASDDLIQKAVESNIISNKNINMDREVSRGEFAYMLNNTLSLDDTNINSKTFQDVPNESSYLKSIENLCRDNVIFGDGSGRFRPYDKITKEDAAVYLFRAFNLKNDQLSTPNLIDDNINPYAKEAINASINLNIIDLSKDGYFYPKDHITVKDAVEMIINASQLSSNTNSN